MPGYENKRNGQPLSHWRSFTCLIILEFFTLALFYIVVILLRSSMIRHYVDVNYSFKSFYDDVSNFHFKTSLCDLMFIVLWRMLVLLVAYSACRSTLRFAIGLTVSLTTGYNIVKIILFTKKDGNMLYFEYAFIFISLLTHWLMLIFFEVLYRPAESYVSFPKGFLSYCDIYVNAKKGLGDNKAVLLLVEPTEGEREPLLGNSPPIADLTIRSSGREDLFLSPQQSPTGSPVPDRVVQGAGPILLTEVLSFGQDDRFYRNEGEESVQIISNMVFANGWQEENSSEGIVCYSKRGHRGKIYKCTGDLPMSATQLYHSLYEGITEQPRWNNEVADIQILKTVDDQTDIIYIVSSKPIGGLVQQRDFVQVRFRTKKNGAYYIVGRSLDFPGCPHKPGLIRGENGPGGYIIQPNQSTQNICRFTWLIDTSLKGWLPQYLIDQTLTTIAIHSFKNLNIYVEQHLK